MNHHYLVGYMTSRGRYGAVEVSLEKPVRSMDDVNYLARLLNDNNCADGAPGLVVTGFSKFEDA